jgi:serine/threonine kinase 16
VYLFLPLYSRGNLQDAINSHSLNGSRFSESEMLKLFKGTCEAVRAMHDFRAPVKSAADLAKESKANGSARSQPRMTSSLPQPVHHGDDDDDYVDQGFPQPEGDEEGGFSYGGGGGGGGSSSSNKRSGQSIPLMSRDQEEHEEHELDNEVVFDGDQELTDQQWHSNTTAPKGEMELVPYCHRDLKPAYVLTVIIRALLLNQPAVTL